MKEFILLFLFLSVFTYIQGNRYCVDFLVYDSIEDKSKFDLKAKCYFIQPVARERTCHNINLDCSFVPLSTHPRSSQIRPLTETEIVPGYWWWDEDEYRPRHVRSHYVDVYTLPNCKGTRTALNKVENRLFTTFQLLSQTNNLICYTPEIQSLIMYPRDLPSEGLPLDYYKIKIMFDEGNNSTLETILIQKFPTKKTEDEDSEFEVTLASNVLQLIPIPGLKIVSDVGLVLLKLVEVSDGLENDFGKTANELVKMSINGIYYESARELSTDLKVIFDLIVENTKQWNDTRRTEAERSTNADLIYNELFRAFSTMKHDGGRLFNKFPVFALKPMFSLCTAMSFFIPKMPRWKDEKSNLRLIPLYKRLVNDMRTILQRGRLNKLKVLTPKPLDPSSRLRYAPIYIKAFKEEIKKVMELPYNSSGYIDQNEKLFCIDVGDKDHCTDSSCLYDEVSKSTYEVGVPEPIPTYSDYYIRQCFSGYAKLVRTRFEEAYDGVCNEEEEEDFLLSMLNLLARS